jgi:hypothetical protein
VWSLLFSELEMFPTKSMSATSPITGCVHSVCLFFFFFPSFSIPKLLQQILRKR